MAASRPISQHTSYILSGHSPVREDEKREGSYLFSPVTLFSGGFVSHGTIERIGACLPLLPYDLKSGWCLGYFPVKVDRGKALLLEHTTWLRGE